MVIPTPDAVYFAASGTFHWLKMAKKSENSRQQHLWERYLRQFGFHDLIDMYQVSFICVWYPNIGIKDMSLAFSTFSKISMSSFPRRDLGHKNGLMRYLDIYSIEFGLISIVISPVLVRKKGFDHFPVKISIEKRHSHHGYNPIFSFIHIRARTQRIRVSSLFSRSMRKRKFDDSISFREGDGIEFLTGVEHDCALKISFLVFAHRFSSPLLSKIDFLKVFPSFC